jgi:hypothetical protein
LPEDDGEVLILGIDGKAAPTATAQELARRRGLRSRHPGGCDCGCQRHRGRARRRRRGRKPRRKKGDKSKNGRSATLVVMYTLRQGPDGRLHGPCIKKVYGKFGTRHAPMNWARDQATRRGFPPQTDKTVQIVIDGEKCLEQQLRHLVPGAILTLDIPRSPERS